MIQLPTHKNIQLINILQVTCHPAGSRLEMVGPAKIQPPLQCLIPSAATRWYELPIFIIFLEMAETHNISWHLMKSHEDFGAFIACTWLRMTSAAESLASQWKEEICGSRIQSPLPPWPWSMMIHDDPWWSMMECGEMMRVMRDGSAEPRDPTGLSGNLWTPREHHKTSQATKALCLSSDEDSHWWHHCRNVLAVLLWNLEYVGLSADRVVTPKSARESSFSHEIYEIPVCSLLKLLTMRGITMYYPCSDTHAAFPANFMGFPFLSKAPSLVRAFCNHQGASATLDMDSDLGCAKPQGSSPVVFILSWRIRTETAKPKGWMIIWSSKASSSLIIKKVPVVLPTSCSKYWPTRSRRIWKCRLDLNCDGSNEGCLAFGDGFCNAFMVRLGWCIIGFTTLWYYVHCIFLLAVLIRSCFGDFPSSDR